MIDSSQGKIDELIADAEGDFNKDLVADVVAKGAEASVVLGCRFRRRTHVSVLRSISLPIPPK